MIIKIISIHLQNNPKRQEPEQEQQQQQQLVIMKRTALKVHNINANPIN